MDDATNGAIGTTTDTGLAVRITRTVGLPREEAFRAWTEPEMLAQWWWPWKPQIDVDLREGGAYRLAAEHPMAGPLAVGGVFREIVPAEHLVYTWIWEDEDLSHETLVTVEFRDADDGTGTTEVALTHSGFTNAASRDNHTQGWSDCLDRLEALATVEAAH